MKFLSPMYTCDFGDTSMKIELRQKEHFIDGVICWNKLRNDLKVLSPQD